MQLDSILNGVSSAMDMKTFLVCLAGSALCGILLSMIHAYKNRTTPNFLMTLILLPMLVQAVIMLVNGNVGTGVAVAGAFSLVRFRSMPGNSREITSVFAAMAAGLANGMGYLTLSLLMVVCFGAITAALNLLLDAKKNVKRKDLKITIPESLDYNDLFDDLFEKYTEYNDLVKVKTTNMGTLYELWFEVILKDEMQAKTFMDELRCRNGNLNITLGRITQKNTL